jgi:hypothetical protein
MQRATGGEKRRMNGIGRAVGQALLGSALAGVRRVRVRDEAS